MSHPLAERLKLADPVARTGRVTRILPTHIEADGPNLPLGALCSVETGGGVIQLAAPVPLFRVDSASFGSYDVAPDGQRFLRSPSVGALPITVALDWKAQVDW